MSNAFERVFEVLDSEKEIIVSECEDLIACLEERISEIKKKEYSIKINNIMNYLLSGETKDFVDYEKYNEEFESIEKLSEINPLEILNNDKLKNEVKEWTCLDCEIEQNDWDAESAEIFYNLEFKNKTNHNVFYLSFDTTCAGGQSDISLSLDINKSGEVYNDCIKHLGDFLEFDEETLESFRAWLSYILIFFPITNKSKFSNILDIYEF
jgi:hypothetical protein